MRWRPLSRRSRCVKTSTTVWHRALSKRLMKLIPTYDKILDGGALAKYVGIATMRRRSPGFSARVERLLTW